MDVMRKIRDFPMVRGVVPPPLQIAFSPLPVNSVCQRQNLMRFGNHKLKNFEEIAVGKLSSNTDKPLLQPSSRTVTEKESTTGDRRKRRSTPSKYSSTSAVMLKIQPARRPAFEQSAVASLLGHPSERIPHRHRVLPGGIFGRKDLNPC
jgi:hypothetical protein